MNKSLETGIVLIVFLFCCLSFSCVNSSVTCTPSGNTVTCVIETLNSALVEGKIAASLTNDISILKLQVQGAGAGLVWTINLTQYITELELENKVDNKMNIGAFTENSGVESIKLKEYKVEIKQRDFFTFFPNLKHFEATALGVIYFPFFIQNKELTSISVQSSQISEVSSRLIDHTLFVGLDKLESLTWTNAGITGITPGSFKGLNKLTKLHLYSNMIQELKSCTFEGLENIHDLDFSINIISSVHPNVFLGLNNLKSLYLSNNPSIPLSAITVLKNLETLGLSGINSSNILAEIIQQLTGLTFISLDRTAFNCTCDTEWISKLSSFDIKVGTSGSTCKGSHLKVNSTAQYTNCESRSYQCFNKSIVCVGDNWNRVDTVDGCECVNPEASYSASVICNDINECENSTICQGNCTNTPGSYKCSCLEGFHNVNDTLCGDIDECIVGNGNCSHYCSNSVGSFECSCLTGYEKQGFSGCVDINECLLSNGNCSHNCSNTVGSFECTCLPGYLKHGSTECSLPNACTINNGGCHHNCTGTIDGYVCSCFEGFKVSPVNSSHCYKVLIPGTEQLNANSKETAFYVLLFLCFLFLATIVLLFVFLIFVFLYLRHQIQLLKPTPAPIALSLAELDRKKQEESTVYGNPDTSQSVPVD